ncbi:MAG: hypothetical protein MUO89_00540 [Dehalococcoidia bacterium]|nr:hypothetical protein [Dehalococcoidia bacterium]
MGKANETSRKAVLNMELATFGIPPAGEILVLTKRCPIGPKAAKSMLDTVAPDQFELIQPEDDLIDGILVKKFLFLRADKEALIEAILQEAKAVMSDQCMITIKCDVTVTVRREI